MNNKKGKEFKKPASRKIHNLLSIPLNPLDNPFFRILLKILTPFDKVFLRLNKLSKYPPLLLRCHVSRLGFIDGPGYEFYVYLKLLANLKNGQRLLDIGCGCGLLELALEENGWRGDIVGIDIHKPSIDWCTKTISKRIPQFQFIHANIYNDEYWREGKQDVRSWLANFADHDFHCVVAKSVFTHLLPDELNLYLSDISKRLLKDGKGILTFFLLNEETSYLQSKGLPSIKFVRPAAGDKHAVRYLEAPLTVVAYDEDYLLSALKSHGLALAQPIFYGTWSGRDNGFSFQDMVLVHKE